MQQAIRRYKITPRQADQFAQCPLRFAEGGDSGGSKALQWGAAIHELLKIDGRRQLGGYGQLDPDELVRRGSISAACRDDAEYVALARSCVTGFRAFITDQALEVLRVEEFVRSADRDIAGMPWLKVWFSGRIDMVARRPNGRLVLVDVKTGYHVPAPLDLAELPSTFVYSYLGLCLRSQQPAIAASCTRDIEVLQVLPHKGEWTSTQLNEPEMTAGRGLVRRMVLAMDGASFMPTPGQHCAYCPISDRCPGRPPRAEWEAEPL
jgi:hypothetical protein